MVIILKYHIGTKKQYKMGSVTTKEGAAFIMEMESDYKKFIYTFINVECYKIIKEVIGFGTKDHILQAIHKAFA